MRTSQRVYPVHRAAGVPADSTAVGADRRPAARRAVALLTALALAVAVLVTGAATARPAGATTVEDTFTAKLNHARTARRPCRASRRAARW